MFHHANVLLKTHDYTAQMCMNVEGIQIPECCENTEPVEDTVDDDDASEDDTDTDYNF
mgnify:CR=1 FL=1